MKNFKTLIAILFIALLTFAACDDAEAQMRTDNLRPGVTYVDVSTDYTLTNAVAQYWAVNAGQNYYTAQELVINLDSASGNHTNVAIQLQGRITSMDAWANIGSAINWLGTTSDTSIVYSNTTENKYRQFKILYTGTGTGTTTIDRQVFKQYFGLP